MSTCFATVTGILKVRSYDVPCRVVPNGILGCQREGAKHDEDKGNVGEDLVVDQTIAAHTEPVEM